MQSTKRQGREIANVCSVGLSVLSQRCTLSAEMTEVIDVTGY